MQSGTSLELSATLSSAVGQLIDRAKIDRRGIFWTLHSSYRQGSAAATFENSLGYGTTGVLLTLLEYYLRTHDSEVLEVLHKGTAWVTARAKEAPFSDGFYTGSAGVWYFLNEVERTIPDIVLGWREAALDKLKKRKEGVSGCNLLSGVSGTLVGVLTSLKLSPDEMVATAEPLLRELISGAKLLPQGIAWDFLPTSIRPSTGFLTGNAGIEYVLAHARQNLGISYTSHLRGSLAYSNSCFDPNVSNWLDPDGTQRMRSLSSQDVDQVISSGDITSLLSGMAAEDALGWSTGTLGFMLSRQKVSAAYEGHPVSEAAQQDEAKAQARLMRIDQEALRALDSSLATGVAGIAATLSNLRNEALLRVEGGDRLIERVCDELSSRGAPVQGDDFSLLSGSSGLIYSSMLVEQPLSDRTVLDPLRQASVEAEEIISHERDIRGPLSHRFPSASSLIKCPAGDDSIVLNLTWIRDELDSFQQGADPTPVTRAARQEVSLYETLSKLNFQSLLWKELSKQRRFVANYGEAMDDNLLYGRFQLDPNIELFDLKFDPHARPPVESSAPVLLIRYATSSGVNEGKLSPLQYALLSSFASGAVALEVIHTVIKRIDIANASQRQLADLSLKMVRGFIQSGHLESVPTSSVGHWMTRKRLKNTRKLLYPA